MKLYRAVLVLSALVAAAAAYPGAIPDASTDANVAAADKAVHQQIAQFLNYVYAVSRQQQPNGASEVVEELIAASVPESVRKDALEDIVVGGDAGLSDEVKDRIKQHILEWSLQYIPEDIQKDVKAALEEYKSTGQVSGNNDQLVERLRQHAERLRNGRNKRGWWSDLFFFVVEVIGGMLLG